MGCVFVRQVSVLAKRIAPAMTDALDRCTAALGNANVKAFLRVIREGESGQDDSAYTIINGGGHFTAPPWRHPYHGIPTTQGGKAAGAPQFLGTTWARVDEALGFGGDFSPINQDLGAVYLIEGRGALPAVMEGDLVFACSKLAQEWVSLPELGLERVQRVFMQYGGKLTAQNGAGAPISPSGIPTHTPPQPERAMAPLLFLPSILEMIPSLIGIFGKGERAQQNAQAAQIVVDAFRAAVPGAINEQDAVQRVQADPALKAQVKAAVMADPNVLGLVEVGGGIIAARTANLAMVQGATHWWQLVLNPVLLVTLLTLPLVYMFTWGLIPFLSKVSSDVISQTMGTVIGLVLGSIMGFWMGQTYTANNKRSSDPQA
jgi:muramidase (phage lysozyme)